VPLEALDAAARLVPALALAALALFFGRTLRAGRQPLIERIALVGDPALPAALRRYARRLTAVWCAYFVLAALVALLVGAIIGLAATVGSVLFFVGEHRLRSRLFPGHRFPGLVQQLRDTWSVWRPS
jgi:uncharacterized membrane protein